MNLVDFFQIETSALLSSVNLQNCFIRFGQVCHVVYIYVHSDIVVGSNYNSGIYELEEA